MLYAVRCGEVERVQESITMEMNHLRSEFAGLHTPEYWLAERYFLERYDDDDEDETKQAGSIPNPLRRASPILSTRAAFYQLWHNLDNQYLKKWFRSTWAQLVDLGAELIAHSPRMSTSARDDADDVDNAEYG